MSLFFFFFLTSGSPTNKTPNFIRFKNKQMEKSKLTNTPKSKGEDSRSSKRASNAVAGMKSPKTGVKPQKNVLQSGLKSPKAVKAYGNITQKSPKKPRKSVKALSPQITQKSPKNPRKSVKALSPKLTEKLPKNPRKFKQVPSPQVSAKNVTPTNKKSPKLRHETASKGISHKKVSPSSRDSALPKPLKENIKPGVLTKSSINERNGDQ